MPRPSRCSRFTSSTRALPDDEADIVPVVIAYIAVSDL